MADDNSSQDPEILSQRDAMLRFADNIVNNTNITTEEKLSFAELKSQQAEIWEKHHRLGHLRHIDGNKMASDLREMAQSIKVKLGF